MKLILALLVFTFATSSFAGGGVDSSGGGGGIKVDGHVYLYDLFEAGLHESPYYETNVPDVDLIAALEQVNLPAGTDLRNLARKLEDIEVIEPYLAAAILESLKTLTWRGVEHQLLRSDDFKNEGIEDKVLQLGSRRGSVVQIQKQLWTLMNAENRTALLIHEAMAALQPLEAHGNQGPLRRAVAFLFDKTFYDGMLSHGEQVLAGFPSYFEAKKRYPVFDGEASNLRRMATRIAPVSATSGLALKAGSQLLLSPRAHLYWVDRTFWRNADRSREMDVPAIVENVFISPLMSYCETPMNQMQLTEMTIEAFVIKVSPMSYLKDGSTYPMLSWKLEPKTLTQVFFSETKSATKANCTSENRAQIATLNEWSTLIRGD